MPPRGLEKAEAPASLAPLRSAFGLAAGTVADRVDRPRQLAAVALAGLPLMAGFSWFAAAGRADVWLLLLMSFAVGCLPVFEAPARQTLAMDTVPPAAAPTLLVRAPAYRSKRYRS